MIRSFLIAAAALIAAAVLFAGIAAGQEPLQLYAYIRDSAGKWSYQAVVLEGATLDVSKVPPVLRLAATAPASIRWSQIVNPPVWKFNGPFLRHTIEPVSETEQELNRVSLYFGSLCSELGKYAQ